MAGKEETSRPKTLHFRKHATHLLVKYCHLVVTVTVKSSVDGVGKNTNTNATLQFLGAGAAPAFLRSCFSLPSTG